MFSNVKGFIMENASNKKLIVFLIIFVINVLFFVALQGKTYDGKDKIIFLNVGEGDATLILGNNDNQILIDGGSGQNIMQGVGKYLPFYDHSIEMMVITHPDSDHIGGLVDVLKYYEVKEILRSEYSCDTLVCRELEKEIKDKNIKVVQAKVGQDINIGDVELKVIYLNTDKKLADDNDNSVVIMANVNRKKIIMAGDASSKVEVNMIKNYLDLDADILHASHHGSKTATSQEFIEKVSPEQAIISVGKNKYGHPSDEVISRLKNMGIDIKRTDVNGDIVIE